MPENTAYQNSYNANESKNMRENVTERVSDFANRLDIQQNWKRALMIGSFAAAAYLLATGRRPAGFAMAGVGLATLAAEYPEKFEEIWNRAPEYLDKGQHLVGGVSRIVDQIAEQAGKFQQMRGSRSGSDYIS